MQRERDRLHGLDTGGFVSGYRGSPLGGLDLQLWKAREQLAASGIVFQPGLNEELAATACWGSQQAELMGEGRRDGVFALWYGKGPGVDRSGDVFRHANLAGSSRHGGVLALMGDDHMAESLDQRACDGVSLRRHHDPHSQPRRGPGGHRLRPLRLCDVAFCRHLGGNEMREGQHRIRRLRSTRRWPGSISSRRSSTCRRAA